MKFYFIKIATNFVSCKGVCWQRVEGGAWLVGPDGGGLDTAFLYPGTDATMGDRTLVSFTQVQTLGDRTLVSSTQVQTMGDWPLPSSTQVQTRLWGTGTGFIYPGTDGWGMNTAFQNPRQTRRISCV